MSAQNRWSGAGGEVRKLILGLSSDYAEHALIMSLVAYIDDSKDPTGTYVLAGHVATVENWAKLSEEWEKMLPFATLNKNNKYEFKMVEMTKTPERLERIQPFYRLIEKYVMCSLSACINMSDLEPASRRVVAPRVKVSFDIFTKPFFFTYKALMDTFHHQRSKIIAVDEKAVVDFIFDEESQKRIVWDT